MINCTWSLKDQTTFLEQRIQKNVSFQTVHIVFPAIVYEALEPEHFLQSS